MKAEEVPGEKVMQQTPPRFLAKLMGRVDTYISFALFFTVLE